MPTNRSAGQRWRASLDRAAQGDYSDSPILPAFHDAVSRFGIPLDYFRQLIDGAAMDLSIDRYHTFDQLYEYCYKVASVVGLVCIHIFGFESPEAKRYAEYCGIAFQLTNILRDLKEDASSGRVYIPEEDLRAFQYSASELMSGVRDERFHRLMRFQVARARGYYNAALPLVSIVIVPSSSMLIWQPVSSVSARITEPPLPITSRILSTSMTMESILGA